MRRRTALVAGAATLALAGCGSSRTQLPPDLGTTVPGQPLLPSTTTSVPLPGEQTGTTQALGPTGPTTSSPFQTAGTKHVLSSGATVVVSYPSNGVRPPAGAAPAPEGAAYALVTARFCAADLGLPGDRVGPERFQVEVPGQGLVAYDPATPVLRAPALPSGAAVAPGACLEGTISYVIRGERHVESITYDAGDGLYRWVS